MRSPGRLALALTGLLCTVAPRPALADPPRSQGLLCLFVAVPDLTAEHGTWLGLLLGGPVVHTEADGVTLESGTISCHVIVSPAPTSGHHGSGPVLLGHGSGVFTAGPALIDYVATATDNVFLCASFVDDSDGTTYYWDSANAGWATDAGVPCTLAIGSDQRTETELLVDSTACPLLATLLPPEGDVADVWDCPPYTRGQETHRLQAAIVPHV